MVPDKTDQDVSGLIDNLMDKYALSAVNTDINDVDIDNLLGELHSTSENQT
ncbi:Uncharacterised protein [Legionella busanensis]|uniref:Uncharacterized protein n=1 Tax=Legionella busanensis TaxID=190655 RepID=A0A378JJF6_9GAMM|nr:hypothetical protein [Legionella busanensis]STX50349.1 Uncharacterised protein [Legionella busanensis]